MQPDVISITPTSWQLTHVAPEHLPAAIASRGAGLDWRPVEIPCTVQTSPFGLPLDELYQRDNIETVRWMEAEYWLFRTTVTPPAVRADEEAVYLFQGIDYRCRIYLNGQHVLDHEGMFSPIAIPLTGVPAHSELLVVIEPFADESATPQTLKARYSFGKGWDFAPKLQSRGIWDEAALVVRPRLRVTAVAVDTALNNDQRADVTLRVSLSERVAFGHITAQLQGVTRTFPIVNADQLALPLNIPSPTLWWPNGQGEPSLSDLRLELDMPGRATLPCTRRVGLRSLDRVACEGQGVEDIPLQLVVNGRPVFLKGVNWVPLDSCPGTITRERYAQFLQQFKAAGVNLIRVWGGGLKEKDAFYALADELGLMVMQEFPLACQLLSREEAFLRLLAQEATAIIHAVQHHPCVVIWTGGNEHFHYWDLLDSGTERMEAAKAAMASHFNFNSRDWRAGTDTYDEPALAMMGELCARLDPGRPFQLTSGMEGEGEVHGIWTWNPAIGDHRYRDYDSLYDYWLDARQHLYSEASVSSIANLSTIGQVLGTTSPYLPEKDDPIWRLHHAFAAAWDHFPDLWLDIPSTEALFGALDSLDDLILANQWMQGEGARFLIEETRRKMGHTCGIIWWGVNEPWPGLAGNALIDYFGRPKLGWQFLANAFQPTMLSLRYRHCVARTCKPELWLTHDGPLPFHGRYEVETENLRTGEVDRYAGQVAADRAQSCYLRTLLPLRLTAGSQAQITCRLYDGETLVHQNDYFFASNEDAAPFAGVLQARLRARYGTSAAGAGGSLPMQAETVVY